MFCKKCGNKLKEGDKFCLYCGNPTVAVPTDAPAPAVQPTVSVNTPVKPRKNNKKDKKPISKKKIIAISVLSVLMAVVLAVSGFFIYNTAVTSKFRKAIDNNDINEMMSLYYYASDSKLEKYNNIVSDKIQEISQDLNNHNFDNEYDENGDAVMVYLSSKWGSLVPETLSEDTWEEDGLAEFTSAPETYSETYFGNFEVVYSGTRVGTREFNYSVWCELYDLAKSKTNYCKAMYYYNVEKDYDDAIKYFSLVSIEDSTYNISAEMSSSCVSAIFDEALTEANAYFNSGNIENALNTLKDVRESLSQYGDTQERSEAIDAAIASYAESYIKKAEEYLKAGDFEAAVGHVEAAIAINPNGGYEDKLEEYKEYLPLKLYLSENVISAEGLYKSDSEAAIDRKSYDNCITYSWWINAGPKSATYYLGGNYDTVDGVFFTTAKSASYQFDGYAYIEAYGDGKLIYTSPSMSCESLPANISFSVTGVQKLEIRFVGKNSTAANINCPEVAVSELTAHKNPPQGLS